MRNLAWGAKFTPIVYVVACSGFKAALPLVSCDNWLAVLWGNGRAVVLRGRHTGALHCRRLNVMGGAQGSLLLQRARRSAG